MADDDNVTDLRLARFERDENPNSHDPKLALHAAFEWLKENDDADHIIVLLGRTTENNSSGTKYFQAGKYPHHSQMGLCLEGMHMIRESG